MSKIGELKDELNSALTELDEETARIAGLKQQCGVLHQQIETGENNLTQIRDRLKKLQGQFVALTT